ncbi:MAG TPA: hypothetical protein VGQ65_17125 [Thermoanaerobaculia bacterium]|nr:hypothetical protein [Thermoanaerobaculia bacterium]
MKQYLTSIIAELEHQPQTLVFSSNFMSKPRTEIPLRGAFANHDARQIITVKHLAGPVVPLITSIDDDARVIVDGVRTDHIPWRSITERGSIPTPLRCPVLRSGIGPVGIYVGAWLIPLDAFGPGVAFSDEHRAVALHAPTENCRWEDCRVEPLPDDEGWFDGWFSALRDGYAIRTTHGGWLAWPNLSFYRRRFAVPQIGSPVRYRLALLGDSLATEVIATELQVVEQSAADVDVVRAQVVRDPNNHHLKIGALKFPLYANLDIASDATEVQIRAQLHPSGRWSLKVPGQKTDSAIVPAPKFKSSMQRAIRELEQDVLGTGDRFLDALGDLEASFGKRFTSEMEDWLASQVTNTARVLGESSRVPGLSMIIAAILKVPARSGIEGKKRDPWPARYKLTMSHYLAGGAIVEHFDGNVILTADPLAEALKEYPSFSINKFFFHDAPSLCLTLARLGDIGYRLLDLHLYKGCSAIDLVLTSASKVLPGHFRIVAQYGRADDLDATIRELLRGAPIGHARVLVVCVTDRDAPGNSAIIRRSQSLAVLESAAFACPDAHSPSGWAAQAAYAAHSYNSVVPNPINAFSQEARTLSPTQFIGRPALLAELQSALESGREPVGVFSMRKAGKTATAMLLSTTFRFQHHFVTIGREWNAQTDPGSLTALMRRIDDQLSAEERKPLLILDEFDTFCRELAMAPRAVALTFLSWLEDHARKHPVLCIGLDSTALPAVYPESNPLQTLRPFLLPYFSLSESRDFAAALGRQLIIPEHTIVRVFTLAGGHPGVMLNLFQFALSASLGFPQSTQFIPANTTVVFTDELWHGLQSEFGAPDVDSSLSRSTALVRILETRRTPYSSIGDPWILLAELATLGDAVFTPSTIADVARRVVRTSAKDPTRSPADLINQLIHWGVLRRAGEAGALEFGIPLLRVELSRGGWICPLPN